MAKVQTNPIIQGLSGKVGHGLMFRRLRDGRTILCQKPDFSRPEFSEKQISHQQRFKAAAAYAKEAAQSQSLYAEMAAESLKSAYNLALSDWFHAPEISGCDWGNWTGQAGDEVRIRAVDDVLVAAMQVTFNNEQAEVIAGGEAIQLDETWWRFVMPSALSGACKITVTVVDLAGNVSEKTWELPPYTCP